MKPGYVLIACLMALAGSSAHAAEPAREPKPLTIATGPMPATRINPYDSISITRAWLYSALYDAMTYVDREGKLIPWLADSWTQTSENAWVFNLRKDIAFSNGQPLTADDVVRTISYLGSAEGRVEPTAPFVANVAQVNASGTHTVNITTKRPDPALPRKLALIRIAALPDNAAFSKERLMSSALGTGPYVSESWAPNRATFLKAPNSWRKAPTTALQGLSIPDATARKNAIITGTADVTFAAFDFSELGSVADKNYVLEEDHIPAVVGLAFNTTKETPFRDLRVRQAVIAGVNVKAIVDALFADRARLATQPARHEFLGYNPDIRPSAYDVEKAKALLNAAGYADGFKFTLALSSGGTVWDQVFQMVASDLRKINVTLEIQLMPESTVSGMVYNTGLKTDALGVAYFSPSFDSLDVMTQHTCSWHVAWYCDQEAEALRTQALDAKTLEARTALTQKLMARAHDQAQALFMYESVNLVSYAKRIKGFRSDFGFLRYELMTVE